MSTDNTQISSLLFGIQWDLVCKYLELNADGGTTTQPASYYIKTDSTNWGNFYNKTLEITNKHVKKYDTTTASGYSSYQPCNTSVRLGARSTLF